MIITDHPADELRRSELRYRALIEAFSIVLWGTDLLGNFTHDAKWSAFTGQPPEDASGWGWLRCVHPEDQQQVRDTWLGQAASFEITFRLRRADGEYRPILCRAVRTQQDADGPGEIFAKGNDVSGMGSLADVCELLSSANQARANEQLFRTMADGCPFMIWVHDAGGQVSFVNQSYLDFFKVGLAEVHGAGWQALIHPDDSAEYVTTFEESVKSRTPWRHEVRVRRHDGEWRWIMSQSSPRFSATGEFLGVVGCSPDITEQKLAQQALDASEKQLRLITDSLPVLVSYIDSSYRYRFANATYTKWFGVEREHVIGSHVATILGERAFKDLQPFMDRALAGETVAFENTAHYLNKAREIQGTYVPDRGPDGVIRGFIVLVEDITEKKRWERELVERDERLRLATSSGRVGLWDWDTETNQLTWTDSLYRIHGVTKESFGHHLADFEKLIHPEDADRMAAWIGGIFEGGQDASLEFRAIRPDGQIIWLYTTATLVKADGRPTRLSGAAMDVTQLKRVETELRRANKDLEQFAYTATHDLQEPLRSVKIFSELLVARHASQLDGEGLKFLEFLQAGATRMETLVRDLLAYTKAGRTGAVSKPVDASDSLETALENLRGAIDETKATIQSDPLPTVPVHGIHLQQLFQNLVGNALKYHHPDRPPEIRIGAVREDGMWRFSVQDNGIGIPLEYQERIFGIFKRLHTADEYSGTGIGLAICQRIVEQYSGRIWVTSEAGQGSTFYFTLPA